MVRACPFRKLNTWLTGKPFPFDVSLRQSRSMGQERERHERR
jgi:hypothetical protein